MHFEIDIHFLFGVWHCCKGTNSSKPERKLCQKRHNNHSHSSWIISTKHIISDNLSGNTYILLNKILPFLVHCATRQRDQRDLIPVKTQWYTSFLVTDLFSWCLGIICQHVMHVRSTSKQSFFHYVVIILPITNHLPQAETGESLMRQYSNV